MRCQVCGREEGPAESHYDQVCGECWHAGRALMTPGQQWALQQLFSVLVEIAKRTAVEDRDARGAGLNG